MQRNVRVRLLASDEASIPGPLLRSMRGAESATRDCTGMSLNLCVSYGARGEIVGACRELAADAKRGALDPAEVDEQRFERALLTGRAGLPDPDLLIRTSGEQRISNFLLWQLAYTELAFVPCTWPEMSREMLCNAFRAFAERGRRFGK